MGRVFNPLLLFMLLAAILQCSVVKSTTPATKSSTAKSSTSNAAHDTTLAPEEECGRHNDSCKSCLDVPGAKCLYCYEDNKCKLYPAHSVIPSSSVCPLDQSRWAVCWLNFEALIISVSVIGGLIIITIASCCIYCCCCRGGNKKRYEIEDNKIEQQKMERKVKQDERKSERRNRLDEIRRKYGLVKDDAPYQRFDA